VERLPDDLVLPPRESLAQAQRLLDSGRPFHAHEILEGTWKAAPPAERDLWQGLAQLAVGLTHAARGNRRGAATLLRRGAARLAPYRAAPPYDVDVEGLLSWASDGAARAESDPPEPGRGSSEVAHGGLPVPRLQGRDAGRLPRAKQVVTRPGGDGSDERPGLS
jgi:hypothetical protein